MITGTPELPSIRLSAGRFVEPARFRTGVPLFLVFGSPGDGGPALTEPLRSPADLSPKLGRVHAAYGPMIEGFFASGGERCFVHGVSDLAHLASAMALYKDRLDIDLVLMTEDDFDLDDIVRLVVPGLGPKLLLIDHLGAQAPAGLEQTARGDVALFGDRLRTIWGGQRRAASPLSWVAGMLGRLDRSPANQALPGALDVEDRRDRVELQYLSPEQRLVSPEALLANGVNTLVALPGRGVRLRTTRCVDGADLRTALLRVAVERWAHLSLNALIFEPAGPTTRRRLARQLGTFLEHLRRRGLLQGDRPAAAWRVVCDETNNDPATPEVLAVEVAFAPAWSVDTIQIRVVRAPDEAASTTLHT